MKKLKSIFNRMLLCIMALTLAIPSISGITTTAADTRKNAEAAYGTPIIDGKIDEIWNTTNANVVKNCTQGFEEYKGWVKALWDENYIYFLAKVYSVQLNNTMSTPYECDSVDFYIDENMMRTDGYQDDDYQVRSDFEGAVSGNNYPDFNKIKTGTDTFDDGFIVEMAVPLTTVTPKEGLEFGFEVLMTAAETLGVKMRTYNWNTTTGWKYNNTSLWGTMTLKKSVNVVKLDEPEWVPPTTTVGYTEPDVVPDEPVDGVTVKFDSTTQNYSIMHLNEYPAMTINDLAAVIGGSAEGYALTKDDVTVKFTEGSRLAEYNGGHLMLERAPKVYNGQLYVPVSVVMPTLKYYMHYNRFDKIIEISTGTDYPDTEVVVYAKDYGAVGDGVTNDLPAITHAINAAINSGKPSKVELEENKTYLIGERVDNLEIIYLEGVSNFTFDGKGSELLIEKCTNSFLRLENCTNVKFQNVDVDYKEVQFSQGRVLELNPEEGYMVLDIDEGYPLPAATDWVHKYWTDGRTGKWWFGQFMDPVKDRLKFTKYDNYFVESCEHIKDRQYKITMQAGSYGANLKYLEVGDRFVLNTRFSAYDIGDTTSDGFNSMIMFRYSGDITLEDVNIYGSPGLGVSVGLCWGRINLIRFGEKTKPGRLLCVNSDGVHYWRNRAGLVAEGCTFMNNLDDHINTKGEDAVMLKQVDDYTYEVDYDLNYRVGDELIFFDVPNHKILAKAYVKAFDQVSGSKTVLTVDRKIDGIVENGNPNGIRATMVYNVDSSGRGSVIRNNTFMYSRRHAYITRSQNSIFEGNNVIECGGSGLIAKNEIMTASSEGPFPSAFTMKDNYITAPSITDGYYPVEVKSWQASMGDSAAIDGFLMENNVIEVTPKNRTISIESVKDLYMINNTLKCSEELDGKFMPIVIVNSDIEMIDGINFDYKQNVNAVINIAGCKVNEDNIKNINTNGNTAAPYKIN